MAQQETERQSKKIQDAHLHQRQKIQNELDQKDAKLWETQKRWQEQVKNLNNALEREREKTRKTALAQEPAERELDEKKESFRRQRQEFQKEMEQKDHELWAARQHFHGETDSLSESLEAEREKYKKTALAWERAEKQIEKERASFHHQLQGIKELLERRTGNLNTMRQTWQTHVQNMQKITGENQEKQKHPRPDPGNTEG